MFLLLFCALAGRGEGGISHRPKFSGQLCADPRLFARASLDFHVYVFDLRAGAGSGGDGGRDDVHANAAYMHGIFFGSVHWWGGGRLMMSMLSGMMLIAFAEDNHGDDDTYGDNNDNDNVAARCPYCYVTFETPPIQQHSCFLGLLDKK